MSQEDKIVSVQITEKGRAAAEGHLFVPGNVVTQHQCPPDRVAMMQNLEEITASYNTRLANQKQVIANLSAELERLGARIQTLTVLLETVAEGHPEYTRINAVLTEEW